jgi:hypothetical protein
LAVALPRPFPAPRQHRDFVVTADERRKLARTGPAAAATCTHELEEDRRLGNALERVGAAVVSHKQSGDLALHLRGDQDRVRLGLGLDARSDVGHIAEVFSPMRAFSSGLLLPAFLRFKSASARWIESAARAARSGSFSCASG